MMQMMTECTDMIRTARKEYQCFLCGGVIHKGTMYYCEQIYKSRVSRAHTICHKISGGLVDYMDQERFSEYVEVEYIARKKIEPLDSVFDMVVEMSDE